MLGYRRTGACRILLRKRGIKIGNAGRMAIRLLFDDDYGACLAAPATCVDSDQGDGYFYTKGYATIDSGTTKIYDQCGTAQGYANKNLLLEAYCEDGKLRVSSGLYCVNGCEEGVCVYKPISEGAESGISFSSPVAREVFNPGDAIPIVWQSVNIPDGSWVEQVGFFSGEQFMFSIYPTNIKVDPNNTTSWQLSENSVIGDDFRIHLILKTDEITKEAWSGTFSIAEGGDTGDKPAESPSPNGTASGVSNDPLADMSLKANLLYENKIDQILAELKELRSLVREQQSEISYLKSLKQDISDLSETVENALLNFITYGVDDNTKRLGKGERAAVVYSYKAAFNKLPEDEEELEDIIKIANGRWPAKTNSEAEKRAKEEFRKIYKRVADMDDPKDNAAITVMAYGLRQKAENRNLESEKQGIRTFTTIYHYHPSSTEDWNIMQAITYSGAARGVDTDGDLLIDNREEELGTDPNNPDTDGDGFLDGIEVANGFDPLNK